MLKGNLQFYDYVAVRKQVMLLENTGNTGKAPPPPFFTLFFDMVASECNSRVGNQPENPVIILTENSEQVEMISFLGWGKFGVKARKDLEIPSWNVEKPGTIPGGGAYRIPKNKE